MSSREARPPEAITGIVTAFGELERGASILMPVKHAVAIDVGVDDRRDARVFEIAAPRSIASRSAQSPPSLRPRPCRRARRCRPPLGREKPCRLRCTRTGSLTATVPMITRATPLSSQRSIVRQGRGCRRRAGPDWSWRRGSPRRHRPLTGLPAKAPSRSTTCRHSKPCVSKAARLLGGIGVEDGRLRPSSPGLQTHALAVLEIDRRKQDHGASQGNCASNARPSAWLFSGWNWVPAMLPRATIGGHRPP